MKKSNLYGLLGLIVLSTLCSGWSFSQVMFVCSVVILAIFCFGEILERLSEITKKDETNKLIPFNDVIAEELMRIRFDLTNIKIKQDNLGWNKISDEFLRMFLTYNSYNSSFLCSNLKKPEGYDKPDRYQGKIIIVLDQDINIDDFWDVKFDEETLRGINTSKIHEIKSGMSFTVFIAEDKDEDNCDTYLRYAKILSIEESSFSESYLITLEIDMKTVLDNLYHSFSGEKDNKIIRKIDVPTWQKEHRIIPDKK
ncbi:MAG: hypothetical protein WAW86_07645 [Gammaproteobacteria bacterium]